MWHTFQNTWYFFVANRDTRNFEFNWLWQKNFFWKCAGNLPGHLALYVSKSHKKELCKKINFCVRESIFGETSQTCTLNADKNSFMCSYYHNDWSGINFDAEKYVVWPPKQVRYIRFKKFYKKIFGPIFTAIVIDIGFWATTAPEGAAKLWDWPRRNLR